MRFVVSEVKGYYTARGPGGHARPGLSVVVTDSMNCHAIVAQYRTEDSGKGWPGARGARRTAIRRAGHALAEKLNAEVGEPATVTERQFCIVDALNERLA